MVTVKLLQNGTMAEFQMSEIPYAKVSDFRVKIRIISEKD